MKNSTLIILVIAVVIIFFVDFGTFIAALPWLIAGYFVLNYLEKH